jgi:hypothetical protein
MIMSQKTQLNLKDIPEDIRLAIENAAWKALDSLLSSLEESLPKCEWGGYQKEIAPFVKGLVANIRSSVNGGQVMGD